MVILIYLLIFIGFIGIVYFNISSYEDSKKFMKNFIRNQKILFHTTGELRFGFSDGEGYTSYNENVDFFLCSKYLVLLSKPDDKAMVYTSLILYNEYLDEKLYKKFAFAGQIRYFKLYKDNTLRFIANTRYNKVFPAQRIEIEYFIDLDSFDINFVVELRRTLNLYNL